MADYIIEYRTRTEYEKPVKQGAYEFLILPCENKTQKIKHHRLVFSLSQAPFVAPNKYGFQVFHFHSNYQSFEFFSLSLLVQVAKKMPAMDLMSPLLPEEENKYLEDSSFQIDHHAFLLSTPLCVLHPDDYSSDLDRKPYEPIGVYAVRLNAAVHRLITYVSGSTDTSTTAKAALGGKQGVCQDYAHIMLGILRRQGIPARYVSGYLNLSEDRSDSQLHAWVEVYIPQLGWRGFDPANNMQVNDHFIKIAHGRDYLDCQPIKGVLVTDGEHHTSYEVAVRDSADYNWFVQEQQQQQQQ